MFSLDYVFCLVGANCNRLSRAMWQAIARFDISRTANGRPYRDGVARDAEGVAPYRDGVARGDGDVG